ncbi:MAG: hypothetical protein NXY57DRAFT_907330 [Lentinula lateritia]|nr:MAG: hypothetical protein NXY57DRAFT_907330 [Lentinula lateritia]
MAKMMKNHHENLQNDEVPIDEIQREATIGKILGNIHIHLSEESAEELGQILDETDVQEALKLSANYKAPGINGITYEIWKLIHARFKDAKAHNKPAFNIIQTLCRVYNDIELHGMVPETKFSESWLCPLYKKNDR